MEWISVTDRLPPFGKNVLACSDLAVTYFVAYASPQDGKWHEAFGGMAVQHITHWMPMPELPRGERDGLTVIPFSTSHHRHMPLPPP